LSQVRVLEAAFLKFVVIVTWKTVFPLEAAGRSAWECIGFDSFLFKSSQITDVALSSLLQY